MDESAMDTISDRLSSIPDLYFPSSATAMATASCSSSSTASASSSVSVSVSSTSSVADRKAALLSLLHRDASLFLERYGSALTAAELHSFDPLNSDYEVAFHLRLLLRHRSPTAADTRARAATVKNRRRAYMEGLVLSGDYFSEEAMREREPYLHHEYLGRFQDPVGRMMGRPGERWSETLMRRYEEAAIVEKVRAEQERLGVDESEWVGMPVVGVPPEEQMEEEEEEEEEEDEEDEDEEENGGAPKENANKKSDGSAQDTTLAPREPLMSAEEMQSQLEQFTQIMQQKFMSGEDTEHMDYAKIDDDQRLDDHWLREANLDAEEKYFDED